MFEEINAHRQAVQENIKKAFEVGFTGNDIEKAKQWQVGDEATDKHGVTYYVHALNAAGKPLWRKKKDSGANANNSSSTGRGNNSVKSSSSEQAVDISKIPDKEFKRITNMLEKQNPLAKDAPRYLEEEAMSDSELKNFLACAEHFKNDTKNINQLTRQRCSEWAKLAKSELDNRRQSKKDEKTKNKDSAANTTNSSLTEQLKKENNNKTNHPQEGTKSNQSAWKKLSENIAVELGKQIVRQNLQRETAVKNWVSSVLKTAADDGVIEAKKSTKGKKSNHYV